LTCVLLSNFSEDDNGPSLRLFYPIPSHVLHKNANKYAPTNQYDQC
jgi:hypothetical protein